MMLAGIATHMNSRASVARQSAEAAGNPQTAMMNKLALYVFPLGVVVGGPFLPIAILLYWVANNIWTYGQQHLVFGRIEKREEAQKEETLQRRAANAPAPGAKPNRNKRAGESRRLSDPDVESGDAEEPDAADRPSRRRERARRTRNVDRPRAVARSSGSLQEGEGGEDTTTDQETQVEERRPRAGKIVEDRLVAEGEIAGDYLEELLDLLDFDGDIDLDVEGDRAVVSIDGGE